MSRIKSKLNQQKQPENNEFKMVTAKFTPEEIEKISAAVKSSDYWRNRGDFLRDAVLDALDEYENSKKEDSKKGSKKATK